MTWLMTDSGLVNSDLFAAINVVKSDEGGAAKYSIEGVLADGNVKKLHEGDEKSCRGLIEKFGIQTKAAGSNLDIKRALEMKPGAQMPPEVIEHSKK